MIATVVRLAIAAWILVTLVRAGRAAWGQRDMVVAIWRGWRPIHLAGVLGLFVLVAGTAGILIGVVPFMDVGLGSLLGSESNAVFSPLEQAVAATGPPPTVGPDWALILLSTLFLIPLLFVLPWLAFLEEEVFRSGIEAVDTPRQVVWALVFGLAHLIMLVPIGAALAIGVAGFAYGRVYRHAHDRDAPVPDVALRTYRPSRRAERSLPPPLDPAFAVRDPGSIATVAPTRSDALRRQAAGVFHATLWHAAFNSALVFAVWVSFVLAGFAGG